MTHAVTIEKGEMRDDLNREWSSRPDDERYSSLYDLRDAVLARSKSSSDKIVDLNTVQAHSAKNGNLMFDFDGDKMHPTNWSFRQLCRMTETPADYISKLPAPLAAECLNHGFERHVERQKLGIYSNYRSHELRAVTSEKYGRIFDHDVANALINLAGDGVGETRWKVPGNIDWSDMTYHADVEVTKETTTLYASDRDIFCFLVDDKNPVEVGKLANGDPDLMFRGFYVWNSEVGARSFGIATMYLRGVCQNRCLWGVEDFNEIKMTHSKTAPARFIEQVTPGLDEFVEGSPARLIEGVSAAKQAIVATDDDQRIGFLRNQNLTRPTAQNIVDIHEKEEGRKPESVWDFAQGITAFARGATHQDTRVKLERKAQVILDKVAA